MKISLNQTEIMSLIKRSFPKEMIPDLHQVTNIEETGPYYAREFTITITPKEERTE